jgi:preprotein translocase subunit YajC
MILNVFAQEAAQQPGGLMSFLPFILIFVIIWFFMIRPQAKKQKETQNMLSNLKIHDKIVTIGGLVGEIDSFKDDETLVLKLSKELKVEMRRSAVAGLYAPPAPKKK